VVEVHDAAFNVQGTHTELDKKYPVKQVNATLVDEQVTAPAGHLIHANPTLEYPELQVVIDE